MNMCMLVESKTKQTKSEYQTYLFLISNKLEVFQMRLTCIEEVAILRKMTHLNKFGTNLDLRAFSATLHLCVRSVGRSHCFWCYLCGLSYAKAGQSLCESGR